MRIGDWSSDVCPAYLLIIRGAKGVEPFAECGHSCPAGVGRMPLLGGRVDGEALLVAERENRQAGRGCSERGMIADIARMIDDAIGHQEDCQIERERRIAGNLPDGQSRRLSCELCPRSRSEEHTSELQSLMRISYSVFCLKKYTQYINTL